MPYEGGDTGGGRRVYVGNIDYQVAEGQLREEFAEFGRITSVSEMNSLSCLALAACLK